MRTQYDFSKSRKNPYATLLKKQITIRRDQERIRYAVYCFVSFLGAIFGLSWLMYLGHG